MKHESVVIKNVFTEKLVQQIETTTKYKNELAILTQKMEAIKGTEQKKSIAKSSTQGSINDLTRFLLDKPRPNNT